MGKKGKTLLFLVLFFSLSVCYQSGLKAQETVMEKKFTFRFSDITLKSVIDTLRKNVSYGFSYNPDNFPGNLKVNLHFRQKNLKDILDTLLTPAHLTFKIVDNNIVILPVVSPGESKATRLSPEIMDTLKVILLSGKILDGENKKPLDYVSVFIRNKNIGTLSNEDGNFLVKLPPDHLNDSLYFSCLGYKLFAKKINEFQHDRNLILLSPLNIQLKEVKIHPVNPLDVLKKTLEHIPENYSTVPLTLIAFYRETIQQNNQFVGLSEAILQIYKASYSSYQNDQVRIYKARKSRFAKQMDTVTFKFQGGISTSLMLDLAKNQSNFITDEYLPFYNFELKDITCIQGRPTYVIAFDQKDNIPYPLFKGKIYIDVESYAIARADFMISPRSLDNATEMLVRKSPRKLKVKPTYTSYIVNYTLQKDKWYLNYIREEIEFKIRKKLSLYGMTFRSKAEMVITQTDSVNVQRYKTSQLVRSSDIFVEKIGAYDSQYWGSFNVIKPDESLEEALKKVKGKWIK